MIKLNRGMILIIGVLIAYGSILYSGQQAQRAKIVQLLSGYISSIYSGDPAKIQAYWSKKFTRKKYFRAVPVSRNHALGIGRLGAYFRLGQFRYILKDFQKKKGYWIVNSSLVSSKDSALIRPMTFYVVEESGVFSLADPARLLTRDWKSHRSRYFIFRFPKKLDIRNYKPEIAYMDARCEILLNHFSIQLNEPIEYFKTLSPEACGHFINCDRANGYCVRSDNPEIDPWINKIVSVSFCNPHELVHALTAIKGIPNINDFFLEGLAVALDGTTWLTNTYSFIEAKKILEKRKALNLRDYFPLESFLKHSRISYHLSGSFVYFLIRSGGIKKYLAFCRRFYKEPNLDRNLKQSYQASLELLTKKWCHFVLNKQPLPDIRCGLAKEARLIAKYSDPAWDDRGTGNYMYPQHAAFRPGVFDIRELTILADQHRLYFKIRMGETMTPVQDPKSGDRYLPALYLGINRGKTNSRLTEGMVADLDFSRDGGYEYFITIGFGISIVDSRRKKVLVSERLDDLIFDHSTDHLVFSLPKSFIAMPDSCWRFFLFSALQTDYGAGITYGLPMRIQQAAAPFNGGGAVDGQIHPVAFDLLLPEPLNQSQLLRIERTDRKKRALVPMIYMKK